MAQDVGSIIVGTNGPLGFITYFEYIIHLGQHSRAEHLIMLSLPLTNVTPSFFLPTYISDLTYPTHLTYGCPHRALH